MSELEITNLALEYTLAGLSPGLIRRDVPTAMYHPVACISDLQRSSATHTDWLDYADALRDRVMSKRYPRCTFSSRRLIPFHPRTTKGAAS